MTTFEIVTPSTVPPSIARIAISVAAYDRFRKKTPTRASPCRVDRAADDRAGC
jgi:hypothetical protein